MANKKVRLLDLLVYKYSEMGREKLLSHILCGDIKSSLGCIKNPKELVSSDIEISLKIKKYVSRGALKLEKAVDYWNIDIENKTFIDAGCSTGGFTDLLLQKGAKRVYAVDVGYNQLDYSLRNNPKVEVMEKTNVLSLEPSMFKQKVDIAVADISFRSIVQPAKKLLELASDFAIVLIKPQFEWENPPESFNGVVKDDKKRAELLKSTIEKLNGEKIEVVEYIESPIKGAKGNIEYLAYIKKNF